MSKIRKFVVNDISHLAAFGEVSIRREAIEVTCKEKSDANWLAHYLKRKLYKRKEFRVMHNVIKIYFQPTEPQKVETWDGEEEELPTFQYKTAEYNDVARFDFKENNDFIIEFVTREEGKTIFKIAETENLFYLDIKAFEEYPFEAGKTYQVKYEGLQEYGKGKYKYNKHEFFINPI